jgi:hypothetical protein
VDPRNGCKSKHLILNDASDLSTLISWLSFQLNENEDYIVVDDYTDKAKIESCKRMPNIWDIIKEGEKTRVPKSR